MAKSKTKPSKTALKVASKITSRPCIICSTVVRHPKDLCKPCANRIRNFYSDDASDIDKGLGKALKEGIKFRRESFIKKWAHSLVSAFGDLKAKVNVLRREKKVLKLSLTRKINLSRV